MSSNGTTTNTDEMLSAGSSLLSTYLAAYLKLPLTSFSLLQMFLTSIIKYLWHSDWTMSWLQLPNLDIVGWSLEPDLLTYYIGLVLLTGLCYFYVKPTLSMLMCPSTYDNYTFCRIRNWFRVKAGIYRYCIDAPSSIHNVINVWLQPRGFFLEPYPKVTKMADVQRNVLSSERNIYYEQLYVPGFNKKFYFHDTTISVKGYVWFEQYDVSTLKNKEQISYTDKNTIAKTEMKELIYKSPKIRLHFCIDMPPEKYLTSIGTEIGRSTHSRTISESRVSITEGEGFNEYLGVCKTIERESIFYKGRFLEHFKDNLLPTRTKQYIDTFFHPLKSQIWNTVKTATFCPDALKNAGHATQFLACLYGPPGTGKSSLPVRIAQATGKSLIVVDKSLFRSKRLLQDFFTGQEDFSTLSLRGSVVILDEFDHIIDMITDTEEKSRRNQERRDHVIDTVIQKLTKEAENEDDESSRKSKNRVITPFVLNSMSRLTDTDMVSDDTVTVDDLLDIIQGPTFDRGYTIFATTNNYKRMRDKCPRLFRDGRFKPYYFGYPTGETFDEISQFYYGVNVTDDLQSLKCDETRIPTCRVLNHVKTMLSIYPDEKAKQYEGFKQKLQHDIEHYGLSDCFKEYESCIDTESLGSEASEELKQK